MTVFFIFLSTVSVCLFGSVLSTELIQTIDFSIGSFSLVTIDTGPKSCFHGNKVSTLLVAPSNKWIIF